jgi:hypothetical protein
MIQPTGKTLGCAGVSPAFIALLWGCGQDGRVPIKDALFKAIFKVSGTMEKAAREQS